ncbi:MAG TPA: protein kinase [Chthoniobacterales bacterium]|jgi:serine/threonine protein kinase|nr:protein kinase [Chthoniobacterales bacterium]
MEHKIFLGKYRVAADEIALAAPDAGGGTAVLVTEQHAIATIYRGVDMENGRDVSIEVIPGSGFKPVVREELEAEALAAKKINHVNIPALYDFGVEDDQLIYVTEHFDGTSAEEWVNQHGPMPTGAVLRIAHQVVAAMGASAFHKISHHAINPSNLVLVPGQTPEGDWPLIKVLHFVGVAPSFASADLAVASFDKSSHYASPEQLRDGKVDFRSEIYSLGATMWFLLTGAAPLIVPKGPIALQTTTIGLTVDRVNGMPKRVQRLLAQMLAIDPNARPQDPLAFYRQIEECIAQVDRRESMARRFGIPFKSPSNRVAVSGRRRFPAKALALAAVLLALATLGAVLVPRYLHSTRVRNAEEPIGVQIGVPDATETAPPTVVVNEPAQTQSVPPTVPANEPVQTQSVPATVAVSTPVQTQSAPPVVATTNPNLSDPAPTIKPLPADTETATAQANTVPPPANNAATEPVKPAPQPAVVANQPPLPQSQETTPPVTLKSVDEHAPKVAANENRQVQPAPETTVNEPPKIAATETRPVQKKPQPSVVAEEKPKVVANNRRQVQPAVTSAPRADEPVRTEPEESVSRETRETDVATAIPTARPVAPEVRRAEPAAPAEGPDEVSTLPPVTERRSATTAKTRKERVRKPANEPDEEVIVRAEPAEAVAEVGPAEERLPQLPRGKSRARFIGVTADGNWMFSLPSKKIVIVPPPPGG